MKTKFSLLVDLIEIALLVPSLLWCLISSFNLSANVAFLYIISAVFSLIFVAVYALIKSKKAFAIINATEILFLILSILIFLPILLGQLEYILNSVFNIYSEYMSVPQNLDFGGSFETSATIFFVFLSFIFTDIFSLFIIKLRLYTPVVTPSILLLIPCFMMVNTVPNLLALFISLAIMLTFFVASNMHRCKNLQNGIVSLTASVLIFAMLTGLYALNPIDKFRRSDWQDEFLVYAEELTGIQSGDGNIQLLKRKQRLQNKIEIEQDLSTAGPLEQTGELVMQLFHGSYDDDAEIYLKGTAYANYENNKWTILDDRQIKSYPENFNIFNLSETMAKPQPLEIKTKYKSDIIYTPYYLTYSPIFVNSLADIYVPNEGNKTSYSLPYSPYVEITEETRRAEEYQKYRSFVEENYLQISDKLKESLLKIGEENGIPEVFSGQPIIVESIRDLVATSAKYSLDSSGVPEGEDIPVWLLTEADSAYCVHFATTAAMMLRAYGIPARYVTGYYTIKNYNVEDPNNKTDVTTDNAHAWVEYYTDGQGWKVLEATPESFTPEIPEKQFPIITTENIPAPTSQYTTAPTTQAVTQPTTSPRANSNNTNAFGFLIAVFCIIILLIIALIIRMKIIISLREKHFNSGKKNDRAVYLYRYIKLCYRYLKSPIADEVETIAAKAKFSVHIISDKELKTLLDESKHSKAEIYKNCNFLKKLFYKIIVVI